MRALPLMGLIVSDEAIADDTSFIGFLSEHKKDLPLPSRQSALSASAPVPADGNPSSVHMPIFTGS